MKNDSSVVTLGSKSSMGVVRRTDEDISEKNLSEVEEKVATADDFIVFGKASVEVFDKDTVSQKIEMEAFEESLDQFFAQGGNISYQHKDVIVGQALESYELDSDVSIKIGDETHEYEAGDTLETEVKGDTLWLVANVYGRDEPAGSDASVMTRLGAYRGELDGFSVTIKNKEYRNTADGQVISEIDFHSVTVGTGDQIKNPDSLFGVAEFKLMDYLDEALNFNITNMEINILKKLRQSSTEALGEETITHALSETYSLSESAKAVAGEDSVDDVEAKAEARLSEVQEKAEDREDLVGMLSEMTDLSTDEINRALDEMLDDEEEKGTHSDEMDDEEEMDEDDDKEEKADGVEPHAEAIADMMDVPVGSVMEAVSEIEMEDDEPEEKSEESTEDSESDVESKGLTEEEVEELVDEKMDSVIDEVSEKVDEMQEEVAESVSERISEKLQSGATPEQDANPAEDGTNNLLESW